MGRELAGIENLCNNENELFSQDRAIFQSFLEKKTPTDNIGYLMVEVRGFQFSHCGFRILD